MTKHTLLILALFLPPSLAHLRADESPQPARTKSRLNGYVAGPYKVAVLDVTGDGNNDVVLGFHMVGIVSVERGDGTGRLSPPTLNVFADEYGTIHPDDEAWSEPHIHNMAFGDIDGDGLVDLLCAIGGLSTVKPGRVVLARNLGDGRFKQMLEFGTPSQAKGVCLADIDNDGSLDLLYTARGSGYEDDLKRGVLYLRRGRGEWRFGRAIEADAGKSAYYVETADLNDDEFLDIIVPNEHDSAVTYFINPGRSLFSERQAPQPQSVLLTQIPNRPSHLVNDVRAADFDGDGNEDLLTANLGSSTVSLVLGRGDETFHEAQNLEGGKNGAFLGLGDFDSDGDVDFVITHWTEDFASVFLNRGDGTFDPRRDYPTGLGNYGVAVGDLNDDGHLDLVTANYRARSKSVLIGKGDGTFRDAVTSSAELRSIDGKWIRR